MMKAKVLKTVCASAIAVAMFFPAQNVLAGNKLKAAAGVFANLMGMSNGNCASVDINLVEDVDLINATLKANGKGSKAFLIINGTQACKKGNSVRITYTDLEGLQIVNSRLVASNGGQVGIVCNGC